MAKVVVYGWHAKIGNETMNGLIILALMDRLNQMEAAIYGINGFLRVQVIPIITTQPHMGQMLHLLVWQLNLEKLTALIKNGEVLRLMA